MTPRPRLLALDVDGTLLDEKGHLPDAVRDALRQVIDSGIEVVLASGRSLTTIPRFISLIGRPLGAICFNGAATLAPDGTLLRLVPLPLPLARQAIHHLQAAGEEPFVFVHPEQPGDILARSVSPGSRDYLLNNLTRVTWVASLEEALQRPPIEIASLFREEPRAEQVVGQLRDILGQEAEVILAYNPQHDYWSVAVHARAANKGDALLDYLRWRRIAPQEAWAVGDGVNDLAMFAVVGRSFAMGHAPPQVRAAADEVLPPHTQKGVLPLLRRLMEPDERPSA